MNSQLTRQNERIILHTINLYLISLNGKNRIFVMIAHVMLNVSESCNAYMPYVASHKSAMIRAT